MSGLPKVAVQGAPGCFSHAAARGLMGELELVPCRTFQQLFDAVATGRAELGIVPVENALAGAVVENLDLLSQRGLPVVAETYLRVEMCLVAPPGSRIEALTAAGSHPVALRQCGDFFARHPHLRSVVAHDTAGAIQELMEGRAEYDAAIGPALAAELYGAEILQRGIEDHSNNYTRFLVISGEGEAGVRGEIGKATDTAGASPTRKASLSFTLPHRPGALHAALGLFAAEELDLTRLESRPIPGRPWEYRFHADVRMDEGAGFDRALTALRALSPEVQELGRYREAEIPGVSNG